MPIRASADTSTHMRVQVMKRKIGELEKELSGTKAQLDEARQQRFPDRAG